MSEQVRLKHSKSTAARQKKSQLGQFFTPAITAQFMANLLSPGINGKCCLLDAGGGYYVKVVNPNIFGVAPMLGFENQW